MNILGSYKNGNYNVTILSDGTKIRSNDLNFFEPEFPESFDYKITDRCDMGCKMCHENSTPCGKHGNIMNQKFIDSLHPFTELAIGGGNPISHPQLVPFLEKCKRLKLIPSMTVNQKHFMENYSFIQSLIDHKLIYGLGVSLVEPTDEFIEKIKQFPNAVIHVINGMVTLQQLEKLSNCGLKILILGYKEFRRGEKLYADENSRKIIDSLKKDLYEYLPKILEQGWFDIVSFDNLAIRQLDPKRTMTEKEWEQFYMGDDGGFTLYIDGVKEEFAVNSTSTVRFPITDNVSDMLKIIKTLKNF